MRIKWIRDYFFPMEQHNLEGQGLLTIEASWWNADTRHSEASTGRAIGLSQRFRPDNIQHSQATGGIRTQSPGKWVAADSHLRPRSHLYWRIREIERSNNASFSYWTYIYWSLILLHSRNISFDKRTGKSPNHVAYTAELEQHDENTNKTCQVLSSVPVVCVHSGNCTAGIQGRHFLKVFWFGLPYLFHYLNMLAIY
jgi:hypothetical protein